MTMMMMRGYNNNRTKRNSRNKRNNHDNNDLLLLVAVIIGLVSCNNYDVSSFVLPSSSPRSKTVIIRRITHYTPLPMSDEMFPLVQLSMAEDKEESTNTNDDAQKDDKADDTKDDQSDDAKDDDGDDDELK
mmetsp:Transcript_13474/g.15215  ORF Transcript_13474/g.15215 Transcript_13474/m.15215 type:complete len:131 (-) Transcript_13474:89-481(-)